VATRILTAAGVAFLFMIVAVPLIWLVYGQAFTGAGYLEGP